MTFIFTEATKHQAKLRMALIGPSGSGKTYTALSIASALVPDGKIAVIDTERGSASLYAGDPFTFLHGELVDNYHPDRFVEAIKAAEAAGVDVLIIDSLSHEWNGAGGCLELVEKFKSKYGGNKFAAWGDVTPIHDRLLDTINSVDMHIIATMRAKTQYILVDDDKGRQKPQKVGMGAIQRDGAEYEFGVIGELDQDNNLVITKTRCSALSGGVFNKAGADVAAILSAWLTDGAPMPTPEEIAEQMGPPAKPKGKSEKHAASKSQPNGTATNWRAGKAASMIPAIREAAGYSTNNDVFEGLDRVGNRAHDGMTPEQIAAVLLGPDDAPEIEQPALLDDDAEDAKATAVSSYEENA